MNILGIQKGVWICKKGNSGYGIPTQVMIVR